MGKGWVLVGIPYTQRGPTMPCGGGWWRVEVLGGPSAPGWQVPAGPLLGLAGFPSPALGPVPLKFLVFNPPFLWGTPEPG